MAKYKALPNYELIRPGVHVKFDLDGNYETSDEKEIKLLDASAPFIERKDKSEKEKPAEKPKVKAKPKSK